MTEAQTAPSTRLPFHLSPPTDLPRSWKHGKKSKVTEMIVSVNTHRELKVGPEFEKGGIVMTANWKGVGGVGVRKAQREEKVDVLKDSGFVAKKHYT